MLTKNLANLFSRVEKELTWSANLITAVLSFPYIVALLPRGLEIRSLNNILVQKIPLRRPLDLFESVSSDMYIVCEREIWRLVQKSLEEQVRFLANFSVFVCAQFKTIPYLDQSSPPSHQFGLIAFGAY